MNYYNEFDHGKAAWLRQLIADGLIPDGWVDERPIQQVRPHEIARFTQHHFFAGVGGWSLAFRLAGVPDNFPSRSASCPCQPFSVAGEGLAEEDPRHLAPVLRDILTFLEPAITFGEQVASAAGRDWMSRVRADLEGLGYEVGAADLCAAGAGADHLRQRLYWVAHPLRKRLSEPWQHWENSISHSPDAFREADRLVDAFRRRALPFLCRSHDGIPERMGRVAVHAFGDAIVPQVAAEFIQASLEAIAPNPRPRA